jgi:hypothetical protein
MGEMELWLRGSTQYVTIHRFVQSKAQYRYMNIASANKRPRAYGSIEWVILWVLADLSPR